MKRLVSLAAFLFLVALAAGACDGGDGEGGGDGVPATPSPTPEVTQTAEPEASPSPSQSGPDTNSTPEVGVTPPPGLTDVKIGELPADFPDDFPLHDDAIVVYSGVSTSGDLEAFNVELEIDDTVEAVIQFFSKALDSDPWQLQSPLDVTGLTVLSYFNKDNASRRGLVVIDEKPTANGKTRVSLSLSIPPE